ncbi:neuronal acetylcholine receptor subunit alpha-6-like [Leptopilina heterotoma]|uniref:neuronal acetylcholine receptor subunit alpha-6-like n=1 Tax=Leptopilina heterotoma TaxID=63436 RepID=UPI001CA88237|nr:neuronal acetylcholine receptor subunit alpha-6-like [Leptopilina heterotoma]
MKKLIIFAFLIFILKLRIIKHVGAIDIRKCPPNKSSATVSSRLKNQLFCSYDSNERPVERKKSLQAFIQMIPKFMEFESSSSSFTLHFWLKLTWNDAHLTWNLAEFEKLDTLYVLSTDIWKPDLMIINTAEHFELPTTTCLLKNTGNVTCVIPTKISVSCASDFTYWPYDEQKCKIRTGSNTYYSHEVDFDFLQPPILMEDYIENHDWIMKGQEARKIIINTLTINYTQIGFEFHLKRHSRMSHSLYITPATIFLTFTLTVLWLDSTSIERMVLAGVNFAGHLYCIYDLHWMVPLNGFTIPHIIIFYRDSLILAAFALIITIVFRKMQKITATAPKWIVCIVNCRLLQFFVTTAEKSKGSYELEEESDNIESIQSTSEMSNEKIWSGFAKLLEWLSFISISLTYFILLITLVL